MEHGIKNNRCQEAGFTLLELLVALTLLGLFMGILFSTLHFGTRAWIRSDIHFSGSDEIRHIQALLRQQINQAYPQFLSDDASHPHINFDGDAKSISFLAPAPTASGRTGRARIKIGTVINNKGQIMLTMAAQPELAWPNDLENLAYETILADFKSAQFTYFGSDVPPEAPFWHTQWKNRQQLPRLIRLHIEFSDDDPRIWPDLIVAPQISVDVGCTLDPLTKFCRGR